MKTDAISSSLIQSLVQMWGYNDSKGILDFIGAGKVSPSGGRSQGVSRVSSSEHSSPLIPCHPDKGPRHECARCRSVDYGGDLRLPKRTGSSGQHLDLAAVVDELQKVRERHRVLEALVMKVMADVQTVLARVDGQSLKGEGHDVVSTSALRPSIVRNSRQDRPEMRGDPPQKLSHCSRIASASQPAMKEHRSERSLGDSAADAWTENLGRTGVEEVGGLQSVPRIISASDTDDSVLHIARSASFLFAKRDQVF